MKLNLEILRVAIAFGLLGCNSAPVDPIKIPTNTNTNQPQVVATTDILCDLTEEIAGNTIDLTCLINPGTDPHLYQPKPEDRQAIENAKLILYAGYDFEPGLIKLIQATKNPASKIAVNEVAVPNPEPFEEDGKTVPDPHVWHDAKNGIRIVETIRSNLEKLAPKNAALYNSNAEKLTSELRQVDTWIKTQVATIPPTQRKLVTTHDALGYYVKAYGLSFEGALGGLSTEEKPAAARVKELVKDIKNVSVPTIFAETTTNPRLIEAVAKEANVKVSDRELFADSLGASGTEGENYQGLLIANTRTLVEGLGGKYTPFKAKTSSQP
ncbi:zinc ABC transporter substrate-binding protein [Funiculus sociatus GB2-M2]|uniref:metal ABC transporter solute-binding protein, Zn/Mn family n=1 Tax=Cyanophyceae TaxID=3028117 RepID=UPI0018EF5995|nr:zinc ABC transporter substrate-binding protein [Trichocoleus sp. FACHB-90]